MGEPIAEAIAAAVKIAVAEALNSELPRLTLTRAEAGQMLGVSIGTVDQRVKSGDLTTIAAGRITLASVLVLAGWPLTPSPLVMPTVAIPQVGQ